LLGIKHCGIHISQENLKRAYRQVSLLCHPDKVSSELRNKAETRYKLIQTAYDTLSDPYLKILYDSKMPFDDSIQSQEELNSIAETNNNQDDDDDDDDKSDNELYNNHHIGDNDDNYENDNGVDLFDESNLRNRISVNEEKFYKLFGLYFEKWSLYSIKQPVPLLGNANTPDNKVKKFYEFWYKFKSWRTFLHEDEISSHVLDIKNAENAKERKWMEKENKKLEEPFKKRESLLISSLIEAAYKRDPRITRIILHEKQELIEEEKQREQRRRKREEEEELKQLKWKEEEERKRLEKNKRRK